MYLVRFDCHLLYLHQFDFISLGRLVLSNHKKDDIIVMCIIFLIIIYVVDFTPFFCMAQKWVCLYPGGAGISLVYLHFSFIPLLASGHHSVWKYQ